MPWTPLQLAKPHVNSSEVAVRVSVAAYNPKLTRYIFVTITPENVRSGKIPDWWRVGMGVRVLLGNGPQTGMIRIEHDPKGRLRLSGMAEKGRSATLKIPCFSHVGPEKHRDGVEDFDFDADWIEITLPTWARAEPVWIEPTHPAIRPSAYAVGETLNRTPKRDPWAEIEHKTTSSVEPNITTRAQTVVKGFAMAAMALPDPMIEAKEANVKQPKC